MHHLVLEDYIAAVEAAEARRDRLTAQIAAMLPDWTLAPVVAALQAMRGMALVNAATLIAELGDLSRFANPRQLMAYLGLVPSEHSSSASVKRGGLTKAGNSAAAQAPQSVWQRRSSRELTECVFTMSDATQHTRPTQIAGTKLQIWVCSPKTDQPDSFDRRRLCRRSNMASMRSSLRSK